MKAVGQGPDRGTGSLKVTECFLQVLHALAAVCKRSNTASRKENTVVLCSSTSLLHKQLACIEHFSIDYFAYTPF